MKKVLLIKYFEDVAKKPFLNNKLKNFNRLFKKYSPYLTTIDKNISGLEDKSALVGKNKMFYATIMRYIKVMVTYMNRNRNLDSKEISVMRTLLRRIAAMAFNVRNAISSYIEIYDTKDEEIIKKQPMMRKDIIFKVYLLFKTIEKINHFFDTNERTFKKFINYVFLKITDLFEREGTMRKILRNDERYFRNFPEIIQNLRPLPALNEMIKLNQDKKKEIEKNQRVKVFYLKHLGNLKFSIIRIMESKFVIEDTTPFNFTVEQINNEKYNVIESELLIVDKEEMNTLRKDIKDKKPILESMFNIKIKNSKDQSLKNIKEIKRITVNKFYTIEGIDIEAAKTEIDLSSYFSKNKIGEIEIE